MSKRIVKKRSRSKKAAKVVISIVLVLALVAGGVSLYVSNLFGRLHRQELNETNLNIYDDPDDIMWKYHNDVKNYILFGTDARTVTQQSRSDVMILLSVNFSSKTIKMVSLQRDLYVKVRNSYTKMSHAYFYGGPELAVATVNNAFKLNIEDFISVNFFGVADFIDYIGGVELEITEAERNNLNHNIIEQAGHGMNGDKVTQSGKVRLNGSQAVAYARIRMIDSDFERGNRQRKVIMAAFESVKKMGVASIDGVMRKGMELCSTSLTNSEILSLGSWLVSNMNDVKFESASCPGTLIGYKFETIDGLSYVTCDMDRAASVLKDFLYDQETEDVPVPIERSNTAGDAGTDTGTDTGGDQSGQPSA